MSCRFLLRASRRRCRSSSQSSGRRVSTIRPRRWLLGSGGVVGVAGSTSINVQIKVGVGRGYVPADARIDREDETRAVGKLMLDASYRVEK